MLSEEGKGYKYLTGDKNLFRALFANFDSPKGLEHFPKAIPTLLGLTPGIWGGSVQDTVESLCKNTYLLTNDPPKRDQLALINFAKHYGREQLFKVLERTDINFTFSDRVSREDYYYQLLRHKFVISPPGRGLDCYRTYESLVLGAYPVVLSTPLDPVYRDLPVLIIKSWDELSVDFLNQAYAQFSSRKWYMGHLFAAYWEKRIQLLKRKQDLPPDELYDVQYVFHPQYKYVRNGTHTMQIFGQYSDAPN